MPRRAPGRSTQAASSREAELVALLGAAEVRAQQAERSLAEREAQQTATAEVLQAISRAPTDLQAVLDTICESALRLTRSHRASIGQVDGENLRQLAGARSAPLPTDQADVSQAVGELRLGMLRDRGWASAR